MTGSTFAPPQFGAPLGEFRTEMARWWYVAYTIMFAAINVANVWYSITSGDAVAIVVIAYLDIALAGYAGWHVARTPRSVTNLYQGGFTITQRGRTTVAGWSDVASIVEVTRNSASGFGAFGPTPSLTNPRFYTITLDDNAGERRGTADFWRRGRPGRDG